MSVLFPLVQFYTCYQLIQYNRDVLIWELQFVSFLFLFLSFFLSFLFFLTRRVAEEKNTTFNKAITTDSNETSEQAENTQHVHTVENWKEGKRTRRIVPSYHSSIHCTTSFFVTCWHFQSIGIFISIFKISLKQSIRFALLFSSQQFTKVRQSSSGFPYDYLSNQLNKKYWHWSIKFLCFFFLKVCYSLILHASY